MKILKCLFYAVVMLFHVSCSGIDNEQPSELFGLPHIAIEMRESDFVELQKDALVNEYAAITIERDGVKEPGKIRRHGNFSRYFPKPSFHIKTSGGDWYYAASNSDKSYCRDVFAKAVFKKAGDFLVPNTEFVALSVNNIYQGLYISSETIDREFFRRRNIEVNSLYRISQHGKFTFKDGENSAMSFEKLIPESLVDYNDVNILISALDQNDGRKIESVLNVENAAKYSFISSAINNVDGITKNIYICNTKSDNKFRIVPYDLHLTFSWQVDKYGPIPAKFENGLLERAEDIYLNKYGLEREWYVNRTLHDIGNLFGILDSLQMKISWAYKNDPYHQGENLDAHIAGIKGYISALAP